MFYKQDINIQGNYFCPPFMAKNYNFRKCDSGNLNNAIETLLSPPPTKKHKVQIKQLLQQDATIKSKNKSASIQPR